MIDVSHKVNTLRTAFASAELTISPGTAAIIRENRVPKGDPLAVAKVAAVQAVKSCSTIIPYCHPIPVDFVGVDFDLTDERITIRVEVKAVYKTGVEMEAMTGASVAALTLYDMLKMLDEKMEIVRVRLDKKTGGKSDFRETYERPLTAAVLVMSDSISAGEKTDRSGRLIVERLEGEGLEVRDYTIIPDEVDVIVRTLTAYADEQKLDLVVTTGGTGFSPRDCTPEAMARVIERSIPGIPEAARAYGQERTPYAMLSRAQAGIRGNTIFLNLPGSTGGVKDSLNALFPAVLHSFRMLWMQNSPGHHDGREIDP
ncbi:MAG: bifunctional molybdenum cofactor biosynthesis protein MoaC/MoaB [Bacteroidota bacterium]|jgi:molybdenum cofactor biosynthesis protein MoaC